MLRGKVLQHDFALMYALQNDETAMDSSDKALYNTRKNPLTGCRQFILHRNSPLLRYGAEGAKQQLMGLFYSGLVGRTEQHFLKESAPQFFCSTAASTTAEFGVMNSSCRQV